MKLSRIAGAALLALFAQQGAAGVVTIMVDDFSVDAQPANLYADWTTPGGGQWHWLSISPPAWSNLVQTYTAGGLFVVNMPTLATFQASLSYANAVNYAAVGGNSGQIVFVAAASDQSGNAINGSIIPAGVGGNLPARFTSPYASNDVVSLFFDGSPVKAWDVAIDFVGVSFECGTLDTATYTSMNSFLNALRKVSTGSCVPLPGSLPLMAIGAGGLGLALRRRPSLKPSAPR